MYFYIYQITNKINVKIYVGCHSTCDLDDGYFGSGKILRRAIKKYGKENFQFDILEFFDCAENMFSSERKIVNAEFIERSDTYNIKEGGLGNSSSDTKRLWKDDLYRHKVIENSLSKFWNDPEHKAKLAKIYKTEEYSKALSIATKISANHPDKILRTSITSKERWQNSEYRENMSSKTKSFMSNTKFIHNNILKENKRVKVDELPNYLSNGWLPGRNPNYIKQKNVISK